MEQVTVVGSDTLLGAAVAKALAKVYQVKAIPLVCEAYGNSLKSAGIQVENIDARNVDSLAQALSGSRGCFVSTHSEISLPNGKAQEISQGKIIAQACAKARVSHVVFNTQLSVVKTLGLGSAPLDAKAEIETCLNDYNLPLTCIVVPFMFQELLVPPFRPKRVDQYTFGLEIPIGQTPLDMINADDVGGVVRSLFQIGQETYNKTYNLSGDKLTLREVAALMCDYLAPRVFKDLQVTVEQYTRFDFPGAQDYGYMFDFKTRVNQRASMDITKRLYPETVNFESWLATNMAAVAEALDYSSTPPANPWA